MRPLPPSLAKFKIALAAGIVILLALLLAVLRLSRGDELEHQIRQAETDVRTMRRNIDNAGNIQDDLDVMDGLVESVSSRTINADDAAVNKAYLYGFETDQLSIESVEQRGPFPPKKGDPRAMKNFDTVEFTVTATGSFADVLSLACRIRGGAKLVRITSMEVLPGSGALDERSIKLTIDALAEKPGKEKKEKPDA